MASEEFVVGQRRGESRIDRSPLLCSLSDRNSKLHPSVTPRGGAVGRSVGRGRSVRDEFR